MSFGFGLSLPAYPLRGGGGNNPFNQSGPTLDLSFTGVVTDLTDPNGYTLNTNFIVPQYQIAAQYLIWETGVGLVDKTFSQIITFTRASTGTYFDSAGVLQSAAINTPRLDYNPSTLAAQGLLIEEARTNSIRNNTMQGAVAGTPGTLPTNWTFSTTGATTTQVVGTGTENGITYIDIRFQGTGAADTWNIIYDTSVVAANGQSWTSAVYLKLAAGSAANLPLVQRLVFRNSSFVNIQALDSSAITPTGAGLATQRSTLSLTATQATTAFVTNQLNSGTPTGAYDITLRIGLPQLEQGAFATSVIPTTTTALTRSADVASVNTLSPWFNATEGTLYVQGIIAGGTAATFPRMSTLAGSNPNNDDMGVVWGANAGSMRWSVRAGGATQADVTFSLPKSAGASFKVAGRYAANDFQAAFDGNLGVPDITGTLPTITSLSLGGPASFQPGANVWLQRVTFYPRRLSNAELVSITT